MSHTVLLLIALTMLSAIALLMTVERILRFRKTSKESGQNQNRVKRQQQVALLEELNALKKELSRTRDIAAQIPVIAKNLTEKLPENSFPAISVRSVKEFFHATQVGFFTPVTHSSDYTLEVGVGFPKDWPGNIRVSSDEGLMGTALQRKVVVSRVDPLSSSGLRSTSQSLEQLGVSPDFAAPVFGISGIHGLLVIAGCPFPLDDERKYVSMLADLFSLAVQKAHLADANKTGAWKDDLTGLSTRLHFLQRFENEIRRTENYQQSFALFMFDIDKFKTINDTYGHAAGDIVIKKVAEIAKLNTRSSDLVGRFGGDEFLVMITSSTEEQSFQYAENIRKKIAAAEFKLPALSDPIRLTISGGLSYFPTHGQSTTDLLHAADHALYEAKRKGRDRTAIARVAALNGTLDAEDDGPLTI